METCFRPPKSLSLEGNISDNWKTFSQKFDLFIVATGLKSKPEETKAAAFLSLVGDDGLELYNTFTFVPPEAAKRLDKIRQKFEDYCAPKKNVTFERYLFNSIEQKLGQSFDSFITELKKAVKTTEYAKQDEMVRDRIVIGIYEKSTQEKLLREKDLTNFTKSRFLKYATIAL